MGVYELEEIHMTLECVAPHCQLPTAAVAHSLGLAAFFSFSASALLHVAIGGVPVADSLSETLRPALCPSRPAARLFISAASCGRFFAPPSWVESDHHSAVSAGRVDELLLVR
jgi:hypothetical protein